MVEGFVNPSLKIMTSDYINLHVHSEFSTLDGAAKVISLAENAARMGQTHLSLTDHGSMSGLLKHKSACEKNAVIPLYGCELFLLESLDCDLSKTKQKNLHLTAIAKDQKGFELMLQGLGYANQYGLGKSGKFRRAFLPVRYPLEHGWKDHVVIMSGCASSPFYNLQNSDGLELFREYASHFGKDFYGEIMPLHDWDEQKDYNELAYEMSERCHSKTIISNDIHYCHKDDWQLHEIIIAMSDFNMTWNNPRRWKFSTHQNYFRTAQEMTDSLLAMGMDETFIKESLKNTIEVAEKCSFKLKKYELDLPSPVTSSINEEEFFASECVKGMTWRGLQDKLNYWDRLNNEIEVLESKGFLRYMLIVADVIQWAKANGIFIGPARGSSAGSLVAYVLNITDIDPIHHGLQFERFVAPDRTDLPDIDIDVEDRRRSSIENYLKDKYGTDNVGHLSTVQKMLGRSALRDVSKMFEVPRDEYDKATKCIIKKMDGDARAHNTIEDTILESSAFREFSEKYPQIVKHASMLEGQIRGMGVHAAGFVLSQDKLNESSRCYLVEGNSGFRSVHWDKEDLEFFGLVKIDLLGLATHSVISATLELIKKHRGIELKAEDIPFDDQGVFKSIADGHTATTFTLSAVGTSAYCRKMQPNSLAEVADAVALWRPGPIGAGMCDEYIKIKFGEKSVEYICPEHKVITSSTKGQLIYQEQLTELLMKLAGFSYVDADRVRKVVGKKLGVDALNKYQKQFVDGCQAKGTMAPDKAEAFWKSLAGFASYAFNKAHAVSYAIVAYWTAYLKLHYPAEWLCAYLNFGSTDKENSDGEMNLDIALTEAQRCGISILAPSVRDSLEDWSVTNNGKALRAGLKEIRNIGPAGKEELTRIMAHFAGGFSSIEQFVEIANKRKLNIRGIKSLVGAGAFDDMPDVELFRTNLKLTGDKSERAQYLNYDESKLYSREQILKDMAAALRGSVDDESIVVSGTKISFDDAFNGRFPSSKVGLISEGPIKDINKVRKDTMECKECELYEGCTKPVPLEKGKFNLMVVGEMPGFNEDKRNRPFIGKPGLALFEALEEFGFIREMFYLDNVLHCQLPQGTKPTPELMDGCRHLGAAIQTIKPKAILALGNSALYKFMGKEKGILSFSGTTQWSPKYKCWITYCVHPSYAMRDDDDSDNRYRVLYKGLEEFKRVVYNLFGK